MIDGTRRFDGLQEAYDATRPTYPDSLRAHLKSLGWLGPDARCADIGAGTGIFTQFLEESGVDHVYAVDPSSEMLGVLRSRLSDAPKVSIHVGRAEITGLQDGSIDEVYAAQAFHWFDVEQARVEWARISSAAKRICLVWNDRAVESGPQIAIDNLLRAHATQYSEIAHRGDGRDRKVMALLPTASKAVFRHYKPYSKDQFDMWLRSISYLPKEGASKYALDRDAAAVFAAHAERDVLTMEFECVSFAGCLP